jgi:hypothetical protein
MTLHDRIARKGVPSVPDMDVGSADPDALNSQKNLAGFWIGRENLSVLDLPWCTHHRLPHLHSALPIPHLIPELHFASVCPSLARPRLVYFSPLAAYTI